jgi:hypothetical protein
MDRRPFGMLGAALLLNLALTENALALGLSVLVVVLGIRIWPRPSRWPTQPENSLSETVGELEPIA